MSRKTGIKEADSSSKTDLSGLDDKCATKKKQSEDHTDYTSIQSGNHDRGRKHQSRSCSFCCCFIEVFAPIPLAFIIFVILYIATSNSQPLAKLMPFPITCQVNHSSCLGLNTWERLNNAIAFQQPVQWPVLSLAVFFGIMYTQVFQLTIYCSKLLYKCCVNFYKR